MAVVHIRLASLSPLERKLVHILRSSVEMEDSDFDRQSERHSPRKKSEHKESVAKRKQHVHRFALMAAQRIFHNCCKMPDRGREVFHTAGKPGLFHSWEYAPLIYTILPDGVETEIGRA